MYKCAFALESRRRCYRIHTHASTHATRSQETRRNGMSIKYMILILKNTHLVRNCVVSFVPCNMYSTLRRTSFYEEKRQDRGLREEYKANGTNQEPS